MSNVFISYSRDSEQHRQQVLALADRLNKGGIDCALLTRPSNTVRPELVEGQIQSGFDKHSSNGTPGKLGPG